MTPGRAIKRTAAQPQRTHRGCGAHSNILKEDGMSKLVAFVKNLHRNEEGQDLLEYALLVALIALVAIAAVTAAGQSVDAIFTAIAGQLAGMA
jgi:pilus assembly protein Flp/PilA